MCDEHELYRGAAAGSGNPEQRLMFGRTLTADRVRELNSKTYFYEMLKDNPSLAAIHPGVEDDILRGAIDHHVHAYPDFVPRSQDMLQIAVEASKAGMRGVAFKDHWNLTAGTAYVVQQHIDAMVREGVLDHRVEVWGGLGLNLGINPEAVRVAIKYPNFKCIWFPTFKSFGWARSAGVDAPDQPKNMFGLRGPENYVRLVDADGTVLPEVRQVLEIAAEADVAVALGHTSFEELLPLSVLASELGVRTVLDHPLLELNKLLIPEMVQLADQGTYVGIYCQPMIPSLYQPIQDPMESVEALRAVGADRCIAASDFGQVLNLNTIDGVRVFIRALLGFGIPAADVRKIICDNPARLLGLEPLSD